MAELFFGPGLGREDKWAGHCKGPPGQLISVQAAGRLWSLTAVTLRTDNPFFAERAQLVGLALRLLFSHSAGDRRQLRW